MLCSERAANLSTPSLAGPASASGCTGDSNFGAGCGGDAGRLAGRPGPRCGAGRAVSAALEGTPLPFARQLGRLPLSGACCSVEGPLKGFSRFNLQTKQASETTCTPF